MKYVNWSMANGPMDQWTNGPIDQWTNRQKLWRPYEKKNTLKHWNIVTLKIETWEYLTFNLHKLATCDINCIDTV